MVTEPTPFGLHDLKMGVEVLKKLEVPTAVILNKKGICSSKPLEDYCDEMGLAIIFSVPHSLDIAHILSRGKNLVENSTYWKDKFQQLHKIILMELDK